MPTMTGNPPGPGSGNFAVLKKKIASKGNVRNPGAVAAAIGRNKYGGPKMARMAASGRSSGRR